MFIVILTISNKHLEIKLLILFHLRLMIIKLIAMVNNFIIDFAITIVVIVAAVATTKIIPVLEVPLQF